MMEGLAYALVLGVVLVLAWLSGDPMTRRVGILQLGGWTAANACVAWLGFLNAPLLVPAINAAIAVGIGLIGYKNRSLLCFCMVLLYLLEEIVAVVGFATHNQGSFVYYAILNVVFCMRMLTLGGWSVGHLVVRGLRGERGGFRHRLAGR